MLKRITPSILLFGLIILLGLVIRLKALDFPLANGEAHRDFLVAKHIVKFGEYPLTGPCCLFNGAFGPIRNNPVYYYFLSFFVAIKDGILFLGFINILLQMSAALSLYFLARIIFSEQTAIFSILLFTFSWEALKHSSFAWQPYVMEPILILSYLLLALSFFKKSFLLVLVSILTFLISASVYNPAYGILPSFAILTFLILKKLNLKPLFYILTILFTALVILIFYLPWLVHLQKTGPILLTSSEILTKSTGNIFKNFSTILSILNQSFSLTDLFSLGFLGGLFLLLFRKNYPKRIYLVIMFGAVSQFLLLASLFNTTMWSFRLIPVFGLLIILLSEVLNSLFSGNFVLKIVKILVIFLLLKGMTYDFTSFQERPTQNLEVVQKATLAIKQEVLAAKQEDFQNLNFFNLEVFATGVESPLSAEYPFWVLLEEQLDSKFLEVVDQFNSLKVSTDDKFVFVICQSYLQRINIETECLGPFLRQHPTFDLVKNIFAKEPLTIYLAKRKL